MAHILIFMSEDTLTAVAIGADGRSEYISLDGNISMKYQGHAEIEQFDRYIRDQYNIERYEEGDLSLLAVQCGAAPDSVHYLCGLLTGAAAFGTLDIRYLLPLAAAVHGWVEKDEEVRLSLLGRQYAVFTDERGLLSCRVSEDGGAETREVRPEQLGVLFRLEAEKLLAARKKQIDDLWAQISAFTERQKKAKRCIVTADFTDNSMKCTSDPHSAAVIFKFISEAKTQGKQIKIKWRIQPTVTNGAIVQAGQHVAVLHADEPFRNLSPLQVIAPQEGRIFYLIKENDEVKDGDAIAITGDSADTREDVMQWYNNL